MISYIGKLIFRILFMLTIVYAGGFIWMEESSEKTEKSEKSEEAIHYTYHVSGFQKSKIQQANFWTSINQSDDLQAGDSSSIVRPKSYFNISHIYFSSFLDCQFRIHNQQQPLV